jgi:hypothetical protein
MLVLNKFFAKINSSISFSSPPPYNQKGMHPTAIWSAVTPYQLLGVFDIVESGFFRISAATSLSKLKGAE